jgi:DNA-directed RNA polymerase subunit alpha
MTAEATDSNTDTELESPPAAPAPEPQRMPEPRFDIRSVESLSFAALERARSAVFRDSSARDAFRRQLEALPESGEEGRRRALGWWVLAEYERAARELQPHETDDTAAFTRARALMAIERFGEAETILERLVKKYPDEPRPRASWLEARLESEHAERPGEEIVLADELEREIRSAPAGFTDGPEGLYLCGRVAELRRQWEDALDLYAQGRDADTGHHDLLRRFAHLAERTGLDELAVEAYEELLELPPIDRDALMNLGVLYEDLGRDGDAAACYDVIIRNDATNERARLYMGDAEAAMTMYYDEDLEKKEDRLNQILRIPITDFELSVRARNCLNKMQINTLGDLVQRTEQELLSYKNFGETSLTEIKEILHSKGLRLGMPREEAVASIEAHARRGPGASDRSDVMNKPIMDLQLSIRARRTVETLGCLTVGEITKHSAEELLGMPNFGQTSLQELRSKLAELGLKLKGD